MPVIPSIFGSDCVGPCRIFVVHFATHASNSYVKAASCGCPLWSKEYARGLAWLVKFDGGVSAHQNADYVLVDVDGFVWSSMIRARTGAWLKLSSFVAVNRVKVCSRPTCVNLAKALARSGSVSSDV
jgi:hypothetical protein